MDPSLQAEEQSRMYEAMSKRDLVALKQCELELRDLPRTSPLYEDLEEAK